MPFEPVNKKNLPPFKIEREGADKILIIDYTNSPYYPSIEDNDFCMADVGNITSILITNAINVVSNAVASPPVTLFSDSFNSEISAAFHETVVEFTRDVCTRVRDATGIATAALSGGVFQNIFTLDYKHHHYNTPGLELSN